MKSLKKAYLLWLLGVFGCLGLHRLYLNKPKTGRIFRFTFGLLFLGSLHDLFYLPTMVTLFNANFKKEQLLANLEMIKLKKNTAVKAKNYESASWYRERETLSEIESINSVLMKIHIF